MAATRSRSCSVTACPGGVIAIVSHGDPIRAAILHYLGAPLDFFERIEIYPASVSTIDIDERGPRILALNALQ